MAVAGKGSGADPFLSRLSRTVVTSRGAPLRASLPPGPRWSPFLQSLRYMLAPYKTASKFWTETMIELPGVREDGMLGRNGQIGVHPSAFAVRDAAEIEHAIEEFAPGPNGG